jgi:RTX toxin acyltransferase family
MRFGVSRSNEEVFGLGNAATLAAAAATPLGSLERDVDGPSAAVSANGNNVTPTFSPEQVETIRRNDDLLSAAFACIVAILMRSPHYKHYTLADLEWLVLPPMMKGQFAMLDATVPCAPIPVPVAVAFWDKVAIPHLLKQVQETVFKGCEVKMRTLTPDLRPIVSLLGAAN